MCPKIGRKFVLDTNVEGAFAAIYKGLGEMDLRELKMKYSIPASPLCQKCTAAGKNSMLQWIPQYGRWYCYTCKEYAPPSVTFKPSFLILEHWYFLQRFEIELEFEQKQASTDIQIRWYYPSYSNSFGSTVGAGVTLGDAVLQSRRSLSSSSQARDYVERLCEVLIRKIGARNVQRTDEEVTEVVKEREVVVKVRCGYCHGLYDERLDKCPHCGGKT